MRPQSIEMFEKVYLGALAVSLLSVAISWNQTVLEFEARVPGSGPVLAAGAMAVGFAISLLLWWLIARRASNVAKWILVVLTAIGLFGFLSSLFMATVPKDLNFAMSAAANLLSVYAVWLLFRADAAAWLESRGADGASDSATFD
jgi:hypothetical protein